ncbi:MAG: hypothetical protein KGL04_01465 [Elusimicrobia bacterium]|nr:hypothetical protein [Elusimicrobiota bacterium]
MRSKDFALFGLFSALILLLLAPCWFDIKTALFNFGDLYAYHYPLRHLVASSLERGRLPFWNPYIFGGTPLLANPQSAVFYPASLLGFFFPLVLAFSWDYAFHFLWAALGVWLLARACRLPRPAALALSVFYALSPFLVYRVTEGIPTLLASLSWVPWCYLAWLCADAWLLGGVFALQFLSGHPQFLIINALGMALWAASRGRAAFKPLLRLGAAAATALGLCAAVWPLTWQFLSLSVRRIWQPAFSLGYSWAPRLLWTWIRPDMFGTPLSAGFPGYPSVFFETSCVFIGFSGLALALLGLFQKRFRAAPLLLIAAGIFVALGRHNPLYRAAVERTSLDFLRTPSRFLLLSFWGLLLLAGAGLARAKRWRFRKAFYAAAALALCAELSWWGSRFLKPQATGPFLGFNPAIAETVGGRPVRVMTAPGLANPDKTMLYRAMNVNGYDAFYLENFAFYAERSEGHPAADASRSYLTRADTPEMRRLGVADFIGTDGHLRPAKGPARPLVFFTDAAKASGPALGRAGVFMENPETWRVTATPSPRADALAVSIPFYPGWRAYLNGRRAPLKRWDGFLQDVPLPADAAPGKTLHLLLRFTPSLWILWLWVCIVSWSLWLAAAARRFPRGTEPPGISGFHSC